MDKHPLPTADELRQLVSYDPETGEIRWKARGVEQFAHLAPAKREAAAAMFNTKYAGSIAGARSVLGYLVLGFGPQSIFAHRIAWCIHNGSWPTGIIDHIDGSPANNRISNLRDCDQALNQRNRAYRPRGKSGVVGVYWSKQAQKWQARLFLKDSAPHFGFFDTVEEAAAAVNSARQRMGFADRL